MRTGGDIPSTITQSVTLYNTTGHIEKDKNIYFCPLLLKNPNNTALVKDEYLRLFNINVGKSNKYTALPISQWSPTDRRLRVQGKPDDFRCVTEQGLALNYLILTRVIDGKNYYYGFFIDSVVQVGIGTVELSVSPDHFTDVFYLHNNRTIASYGSPTSGEHKTEEDYVDVFSPVLKNNYVARQHYDRVSVEYPTVEVDLENPQFTTWEELPDVIVSVKITDELTKDYNRITEASCRVYGALDPSRKASAYEFEVIENEGDIFLYFYIDDRDLQEPIGGIEYCSFIMEESKVNETNLEIFSQIEEGFKYKRQFRDYKEWLNYGNPFTKEEVEIIKSEDIFANLPVDLRKKVIENLVYFVYLTFSTPKIIVPYEHVSAGTTLFRRPVTRIESSQLAKQLQSVICPIVHYSDLLLKYKGQTIINTRKIYLNGEEFINNMSILDRADIDKIISPYSPYSQYLISAFLTRESGLRKYMTFREDGFDVNIESLPSGSDDIITVAPLAYILVPENNEEQYTSELTNVINNSIYYERRTVGSGSNIHYEYISHIPDGSKAFVSLGFSLSKEESDFTLNLSPKELDLLELKNSYYDTVLTFSPYEFYSLSYLGEIEMPLNKLNYYDNYNIECEITIDVTSVYNFSFLPTYEINGFKQKYYSESIKQTLTNDITVLSSKLTEYLIANRSQMKSQYAVNDNTHWHGMATTAATGAVNIAGGAARGALVFGAPGAIAGAIGGAVQTITGLISEGIDWDRDTKNIAISQKAKLADIGNLPSNLKQVGTDLTIDLAINEIGLHLNHYTIDKLSYDSICKYLERFGYVVNIYDSIHVNSRVGWNFLQIKSFDYEDVLTVEQEESVRQILTNGVTLLHDSSYMSNGHNYEITLR